MALYFDPVLNMPRKRRVTIDPDAAAYIARMGAAPTAGQTAVLSTLATGLRTAGLTSSKIDFGLLGWANQTSNLLRFYSGSATNVGTGNVHNVSGKVTTGAAGAISTGLIPATVGFAGCGFYKVSTTASAAKMDMTAVDGGVGIIYHLVNFSGTGYAAYGDQTTQQVVQVGQTAAGLYAMSRASATAQRWSRTTSGGTTLLEGTNISGTVPAINEALALGARSVDGSYDLFAEGEYCLWYYQKAFLTSTERDDMIAAFMTALLGLGWVS
jgi:hypothetical protein